ncbi:DUF484 family protein [Pseudogulbenkiania ferrooxidans]|uniref:Phytochrome sensor protein n=1 Tax=Pseudogulbenkiania ferrooxidans 2002 TaxID=279714 RepID=B9Z0T8_9NEIS|nr:DUF484 family protein [Pseudogulbenkiania ferrooxidans]EEG09694.1 protein of unknown function DUF484 [Pseudogulbenkiania ferrooxidans 2002]
MLTDQVLSFLDDNPDFLLQHASRFGLQPIQTTTVVPFAERQVLELRERNRQMESHLSQLVQNAESNDLIVNRTHQLALALSRSRDLDTLVGALLQCFELEFGLDRCALRLWHPSAVALPHIYNGRQAIKVLAGNLSGPSCGPYANDQVLSWFPPEPTLESFAMIPLKNTAGEAFGLVVLASNDPQRFTADMQTHYLSQIGELITVSLERLLAAA